MYRICSLIIRVISLRSSLYAEVFHRPTQLFPFYTTHLVIPSPNNLNLFVSIYPSSPTSIFFVQSVCRPHCIASIALFSLQWQFYDTMWCTLCIRYKESVSYLYLVDSHERSQSISAIRWNRKVVFFPHRFCDDSIVCNYHISLLPCVALASSLAAWMMEMSFRAYSFTCSSFEYKQENRCKKC